MLQQDKPDDFILSMGETNTVRDFIGWAFKEIGIDIKWIGSGIDEKGIDANTNKVLVTIDAKFFRPAEVDILLGDSSKARITLGWRPKYSLAQMISEMVKTDIQDSKKVKVLKDSGFEVFSQYE